MTSCRDTQPPNELLDNALRTPSLDVDPTTLSQNKFRTIERAVESISLQDKIVGNEGNKQMLTTETLGAVDSAAVHAVTPSEPPTDASERASSHISGKFPDIHMQDTK